MSDHNNTASRRTRVDQFEDVEIPEGCVTCPSCEGKGNMTAYERGTRSLVYCPEFDIPTTCFTCFGDCYVKAEVADNLQERGR
jgi:DnaJ-class molecular chaperone